METTQLLKQQIGKLKDQIEPVLRQIAVLEKALADLQTPSDDFAFASTDTDSKTPPMSVKTATLYVMEQEPGPWDSLKLVDRIDSMSNVSESKDRRKAIGVALNDLYTSKKIVRVDRGEYMASTFAHNAENPA